jgi:hypothetical protein
MQRATTGADTKYSNGVSRRCRNASSPKTAIDAASASDTVRHRSSATAPPTIVHTKKPR